MHGRKKLSLCVLVVFGVDAFAADVAPEPAPTDSVTVIGERNSATTEATEQTQKLLKIPGTFGDPLQAVYSLPGVVQTSEVNGAPAVRGSGPDDNSFLIDFLPASYIFHDLGYSVFNENLLRDFGLKTAGFGPRYGKATGAIFDVSLREPQQQPWRYTVDASFLRVSALAEGQITDNQAAYVSIRESLIHLLLKSQAEDIKQKEDVSFDTYPRARDMQAKYSWRINDSNRLSVLALAAQDEAEIVLGTQSDTALLDPGLTGKARVSSGFGSMGVNWIYDDGRNRLQTAAGYLTDSHDISTADNTEHSNNGSDRFTIKTQYQRQLTSQHIGAVGLEVQHSIYNYGLLFRYSSCTDFTPSCQFERGPLLSTTGDIKVNTTDAFAEDRWQVLDSVALTVGAHSTQNDYLSELYLEPRLGAEWQLDKHWATHASWGIYHQLPNVGQILPVLGNPDLRSPSATHSVLGVSYVGEVAYSWSADVYYKHLEDIVVDVTTGEQYLNRADGEAYGAELMLRKHRDENLFKQQLLNGDKAVSVSWLDRIDGWLAVSASRSKRHNQLTDVTALFEYDTPIVADLVMNYRINHKWEAGLRWNLRSGLPYTPVIANKPNPDFPDYFLPVYGDLNSARARAFHRLDIRVERAMNFGKDVHGSFYIDIINVYGRQNGGAVQYKPKPNSSEYELEEEKSLPLLPSIGVKFTF
jgi:TonB dependent receptor